MNDEIEVRCDKVVSCFNEQIQDLSNSECEYMLRELVAKFDGLLEQVSEAAMREQQ